MEEPINKINWELKRLIINKYGSQANYALVLGEFESRISAVVQARRELSEKEKAKWAELLDCKVIDVFPG